jgi:pimeloyl-ACP methyl ester carboxylesterase
MAAAVLAMTMAGCAGASHAVRNDDAAAPLDPQLASMPGTRAYWMPDAEFGGLIYVVVAEPRGGGTAPTLVLVHGLGTAGVRDFYPVLAQLAQSRRVVAFDLPGFGHSSQGNERYTPARYAAVLSRVIAAYGHGPVDVMGHSMGGAIALLYAGTNPGQVRRLILVDAAGILHREAWFGHHLRRVTDPASLFFPETVRQLNGLVAVALDASHMLGPAPEIILATAWLRQKILAGVPERIAALALILTDFGPALSQVTAPTLVVWGANDNVAPLRTGLLLADRLRGATLSILPGVGHNVMAEAPAALFAAVEHHLSATAWPVACAPPPAAAQGDARCAGQADLHLTGSYDDVVLENCARTILENVSMRRLVMRNSSAHLVRSTVTAGIVAESSQLMMTGGRIEGEIALDLTNSQVDLAGVSVDARDQPYHLVGKSKALFSVCPVRTRTGLRHWHGFTDDPSGGGIGADGGDL